MDIDERAFNWHFLTASLILSYSQFLFAHVIETYFFLMNENQKYWQIFVVFQNLDRQNMK